jgi:hypothetical protein
MHSFVRGLCAAFGAILSEKMAFPSPLVLHSGDCKHKWLLLIRGNVSFVCSWKERRKNQRSNELILSSRITKLFKMMTSISMGVFSARPCSNSMGKLAKMEPCCRTYFQSRLYWRQQSNKIPKAQGEREPPPFRCRLPEDPNVF